MSWFEKLIPSKIRTSSEKKKGVPEGLWIKCPDCDAVLYRAEAERNQDVCPKCAHHFRVSARKRIEQLLDPDKQEEIGASLLPKDVLKFKDLKKYKDRLLAAQKETNETEALVVKSGTLHGLPIVLSVFEYGFIGGSMSFVVGERFVQGVNACLERKVPFVNVSASGGARMQEALISLFQMSKTSAALARLSQAGIPYISILTDPTMGGVSASLGMLGDIIIAEPKALIGFAGPRVIEQTVRQTLPAGFQRSEFLLEHGAIDMIVDRRQLKITLARLLSKLTHRTLKNASGDKA